MVDCLFCKIVEGVGEASIVYQDDVVCAFLDTLPINTGHTLVIARNHGAFLKELDPDDAAAIVKTAQNIGAALRATDLKVEGVNLLLNDGAEAGQRVFHTHMHVIPRHIGDNARFSRTEGPVPTREELDETAEKIRKALETNER